MLDNARISFIKNISVNIKRAKFVCWKIIDRLENNGTEDCREISQDYDLRKSLCEPKTLRKLRPLIPLEAEPKYSKQTKLRNLKFYALASLPGTRKN